MDLTFKTDQGRFNYRVCAIIIHDGKILSMHDECSPYYYLPGGRVDLHETAEKTDLLSKGEAFTLYERHHTHDFDWLSFDRLKSEYFYPLFLKEQIYNLPENLTMITTYE